MGGLIPLSQDIPHTPSPAFIHHILFPTNKHKVHWIMVVVDMHKHIVFVIDLYETTRPDTQFNDRAVEVCSPLFMRDLLWWLS